MSTDLQSCYRHPDRPTLLACSDCGRPVCPACSIDAPVGQKCRECAKAEGRFKVVNVRRRGAAGLRGTPVTLTILVVSLSIAGLEFVQPALHAELMIRFASINAAISQGEWWRILTAAFLHFGLLHIVFNMWALYVLGPRIEATVGGGAFLALYLASAAAGGAAFYFLQGSGAVGVGASGAIFGLFGLWLQQAIRARRSPLGQMLLSQLGYTLLLNLSLPLIFPGQIGWSAHLGGLVAGYAISAIWLRLKGGQAQRVAAAGLVAALSLVLVLI